MEKQQVISFEKDEGKEHITVGELKKHLEDFDDELIVIMSKDEEGNSYSPLCEGIVKMYIPRCTWSGDVIHDAEDAVERDCEFIPNALVMYPLN